MSLEYEVDDQDQIINAIRNSRVSQLFVEFLQQGGPKPHVVLRLNIDPRVEEWTGCRLAMDLSGGYNGVFHITPLSYSSASHAAHAAFEFRLRVSCTVGDIISAIRQPYDLVGFSFQGGFMQLGSQIEYVDGCRDYISQIFIILHQRGFVSWRIHRIDAGVFNAGNLTVEEGRTGFHEIIPYNFQRSPRGGNHPTIVEHLPLARGTFAAPEFRRILTYQIDAHQYQLPYSPARPQEGDEGYNQTHFEVPNQTQKVGHDEQVEGAEEYWGWDKLRLEWYHNNGDGTFQVQAELSDKSTDWSWDDEKSRWYFNNGDGTCTVKFP